MPVINPTLLLGNVAVEASSHLSQTVLTPTQGPDSYAVSFERLPPMPSPENLSIESGIRFEAPSLAAIHRAGVGADPEKLISEFPEVRRLKNGRAAGLALLWREHDSEVAGLGAERRFEPEYLDPENPLRWDEDAAELANVSMRYRHELIALHHALRRSLAEEQSFSAALRKNIRYEIRYRLVDGSAPVRDGTVAVDVTEIGNLLDRFEAFVKPIGLEAKARLIRGLVVIGAARGFQEARGWTQRLTIPSIAERLLPHWSETERKRSVFFQCVLEALRAQAPLVPKGTGAVSCWDLFKGIADALNHPMEEMLRQVLGPAVERWKTESDLRMDLLKDFLALCNFLGVLEPWRLLWRVHRDELTWAFGGIPFEVYPDTDLQSLRECGFGGLLNAARIERGWNLPYLREAVVREFGEDVSLERLGDIASNREQPDFKLLSALVAALNRHPTALPIDRSDAFLAAYPTFIDLLPLGARGDGGILREPVSGPVDFVPYARPVGSVSLVVTALDRRAPADPEGFPALMRQARGLRGLSLTAAAARLGIAAATLRRYEVGPGEGERSLPGRVTLSVVCNPKGYGLTREKALEAYGHAYWRDEPSVSVLRGRSFTGPVFIEENVLPQIQAYAAVPWTTSGEILFFWRNGVPPAQASEVPFLPSETEMASFLGVPLATYRNWESNAFAPPPAQAEAVAHLLGRSEEEKIAFLGACASLRAERLASLPVAESPSWLKNFPNLASFAASLALRPFFLKANRERFYAKLKSLQKRNPASLDYLERLLAEKAPGMSVMPDSEEAARLISAVHHAEEKARLWPERMKLTGPIAAYTYHRYKKGKKAWDRLTRALRNPRVRAVTFTAEDGSCVIEGLGPRGKPTARVKFASVIPPEDVVPLTALIRRMKSEGRLNNQSRTKAFLRRLACLAGHDPISYRDFIDAAAPSADLNRLCNALEFTSRFIERWKGHLTWSGSVFRYYDALQGKRAALMFLRNRLARGNLRTVHFDGANVSFESLIVPRKPGGRPARRGGEARTFNYADAASVRFLPNPKNQWGRRDLSAPWAEVQARVRSFFERLEAGRGELPVDVQRILGRTYYNIRTGSDVLGGEYLSDDVLDRLGLDANSKEELRHLQALLLLSRGEVQEREEGPYAGISRVLRYYRLLHQMTLAEAKPFYRDGPAVVGPADYELGRVALTDEARLLEVAKGIGVPASFRNELVVEMASRYADEQKRRSLDGRARTPETEFPNPKWRIPHDDWTEEQTQKALKAMAVEARGALSRGDFARATGLTASQLYKFENFGEISEDAWPVYRSYLESEERAALAQRIRVARAVLDLRRKPTEADGGFADAGSLLRFTRFLMIGSSAAQVMKEMKLEIDPQLYLRWEWGFNRMPDAVLNVYSRLLVRRGVMASKDAEGFVKKIREIYRP